jgi:2-polyprenyl-6-methoxyphenol hydroxylase-like FAD-dependent oxidoreductase
MQRFDVCVRGAGAVGRSLALALSRQGLAVALQSARPAAERAADVRTFAVNASSVALLEELRVWSALPADARTPVYDMQVQGDAPDARLDFSAWQQRVRELAWIVDAAALEQELANAVRFAPHITEVADAAQVSAGLLAVCDGGAAMLPSAADTETQIHDYGQTAIAARLVAERPHQHRALQWFRAPDVLALLPFDRPTSAHSYGLVWSLPKAQARKLMALDAPAFEAVLAESTQGACGSLRLGSERSTWPLRFAQAARWVGAGWVLLGDAAHVVHPLAGQGLNLGLGDVRTLAQVLAAREPWRAVGDEKLLRRYARERAMPTRAMGLVTDGLLQLFSSQTAGVRELRNRGLTLVNQLPPLKRWLAARALER